jgi:hypothetical protein
MAAAEAFAEHRHESLSGIGRDLFRCRLFAQLNGLSHGLDTLPALRAVTKVLFDLSTYVIVQFTVQIFRQPFEIFFAVLPHWTNPSL